ncbi:hypothetical protein VKT23_008571 [Stygiomarasmius scandens]|uniref:Uncharacterized protein n=1 Tax=Marasmiellus scandens TaxID=2682957 RepID=A0ABR1JGS9_9AGAR
MAYEISVSPIPVFQEEQYTVSWASEQGDPTPFQLVLVMDKPEESAFALTTEAGGSTGTVVFLAPTQAGTYRIVAAKGEVEIREDPGPNGAGASQAFDVSQLDQFSSLVNPANQSPTSQSSPSQSPFQSNNPPSQAQSQSVTSTTKSTSSSSVTPQVTVTSHETSSSESSSTASSSLSSIISSTSTSSSDSAPDPTLSSTLSTSLSTVSTVVKDSDTKAIIISSTCGSVTVVIMILVLIIVLRRRSVAKRDRAAAVVVTDPPTFQPSVQGSSLSNNMNQAELIRSSYSNSSLTPLRRVADQRDGEDELVDEDSDIESYTTITTRRRRREEPPPLYTK